MIHKGDFELPIGEWMRSLVHLSSHVEEFEQMSQAQKEFEEAAEQFGKVFEEGYKLTVVNEMVPRDWGLMDEIELDSVEANGRIDS
jgi:hypothetical protein